MTAALQSRGELPPTTAAGIAEVKALEAFNETMPPADVPTDHFIHAGCYVRTCRIAAGVLLTSALIKVPTVVIISGDVVIRAIASLIGCRATRCYGAWRGARWPITRFKTRRSP